MNDIILERHGQLVSDAFYWSVGPGMSDKETMFGEFGNYTGDAITNCPVSKAHRTNSVWKNPTVELKGSSKFSEAIPTNCGIVITKWLADRLRTTEFRGFSLEPVMIAGEVPAPRDEPLFVINFHGQRCFRHWKLVSQRNNCCPFCGKSPLVCPSCNEIVWKCSGCGQHPVVPAEYTLANDAHVLVVMPKKDRMSDILEGNEWDGTDFVSGGRMYAGTGLISRRVAVWLMSLGVNEGYELDPVLMDVSKMTAEQRKKLDEVMKATPEEIKRLDQIRRRPS